MSLLLCRSTTGFCSTSGFLAANLESQNFRGGRSSKNRAKPGSGSYRLSIGVVGSYSLTAVGVPTPELTADVKRGTTDGRIDELVGEIKEIFRSMKDGETSPSAYDTAWVARVPSIDEPKKPQFPTTLDWILENQQKDGSWGEPSFFLLCDRLVCTLACVLALKAWAAGGHHIANGIKFLQSHVEHLGKETGQRTSGFEIQFPSMLNEAKNLGLDLPYDLPYLKDILALREKKISRIPLEMMHSVHTTLLYSLEAVQEVVEWERILKLQSSDGSFLSSPSATAAAYMRTGDKKCLRFLTYIVDTFGDHAPCQYPIDLLERIWAVDTIQRLGIDHHFRKEITETLNYVFKHAGKQGVSWGRDNPIADIDDTCMALRLLRLHGYPVSPDVLEYFKDDDGKFICFVGETHRGVSDMFNLYRLSQVSFPGEKVLKEAKAFVEPYLRKCVDNDEVDDKWSLKKALNQEVSHALKYPWKLNLKRVEAREYMNQYGEYDVWIAKTVYWMYNVNNPKYLELAKLDYNRLQTVYKREFKLVMKWWARRGFHDASFIQTRPLEIYSLIASTLYEPEFSACRVAYTKCNCVEAILGEVFERHESIVDLRLVCQAVEEWNPTIVRTLPNVLKLAFMGMFETLNDLAIEASNTQGKDLFPFLHELRVKQVKEYIRNREAIEQKKDFESLKEYIEQRKRVTGVAIRLLPAMFLMGEPLQDHALRGLDQRSSIHDQLSLILSLSSDIYSFKNSINRETMNAVDYCVKEKNCREEEAVNHIKVLIDDAFDELVHECLKPSKVPRCCRRLTFEHVRIAQFFSSDDVDQMMTRSEKVGDVIDCLFNPV